MVFQVNFPGNIAEKTIRVYVRSARINMTTASVIIICVKIMTVLAVQPVHGAHGEKNSGEWVRADKLLSSQLHIMF